MPTYRITDPSSGKSFKFTGDTPPDENTIKQAFAQGGGGVSSPQQQQQSSPQSPQQTPSILNALLSGNFEQLPAAINQRSGEVLNSMGVNPQGNFDPKKNQDFMTGFLGGGMATQKTAQTAPDLLGFLTKKGVGQKINKAVEKATASGASDTWNDFTTEVRQSVAKKLGNDSPYKDIVDSRLAAEAPASIDANPLVTPQRYQDLRQQAGNRIPQGIFQKFQGKSPTDQVDEIIRQVASSRLKDLAGTKNLDKLYSIYSKVGSPAHLATSYALGQGLNSILPDELKPSSSESAAGVELLRRIIGL